jgi:type II secretory pathway component PulJ
MTLIEVMVSLLLASIVIAGGYAVMITQQRMSSQQMKIQGSQQGLWVSMEMIQRDVRKAGMGFGFCRYQELNGFVNRSVFEAWRRVNTQATRYYALTVVDGSTTDPDQLYVTWGAPRSGGLPDSKLQQQTTPIWQVTSINLDSNKSTPYVVHWEEPFLYPAGCDCAGGGTACTAPDGTAAKPFPLALLFSPVVPVPTPPVPCSVVQVTGVGTATCNSAGTSPALALGLQATAPWNRGSGGAAGHTYTEIPENAQVLNLGDITRVHWYVQSTAVAGLCPQPPCLIRATIAAGDDAESPQVVATGIEDLQIVPACDVNGDGAIGLEGANAASRQTDEWFNNVAGESVTIASTGCLTYPQVRISLVARTSSEDPSFTPQARPALENRAPASTTDRYRRRVMSTVVAPPNVGI